MPAPKAAGRLAYVDGLRAVAVLLVIAFHIRLHTPGVDLGEFFKECSHGVDLFFVLSGFCLALPVLERLQVAGTTVFDVVGFTIKRCLRIIPPYFAAVLLFAVAASIALSKGVPLPPGMTTRFDWSDVIAQLLFFDRNLKHLNSSFWSLAIEFRWYFAFPFALALWVARPRAFILAIALIILAAEETRASSTDLGVLDAFLLGIVAAQWRVSGHALAKRGLLILIGGALIGLVVERTYHFPIQTNFGWHLAAFGLVIYAGQSTTLQRFLANPLLVAVGIASYSIYLVHEPVVSAIVIALAPLTNPLLSGLFAGAMALLGGFALWAIVERPITHKSFVVRVVSGARASLSRTFERVHLPTDVTLHLAAVPERAQTSSPAIRSADTRNVSIVDALA
jgi:peptidoglycan/LPS O-acetylase OafA/YrhL